MQIPISVNRSKAAGPTACSRAAGLAASVWRGARQGRAGGKLAGAGSGQCCKVQPGELPQRSGEGGTWDLAILLSPPRTAYIFHSCCPSSSLWEIFLLGCSLEPSSSPCPAADSQLAAVVQPRVLGCSHVTQGSLQSSPLVYQFSLEEGSVPQMGTRHFLMENPLQAAWKQRHP